MERVVYYDQQPNGHVFRLCLVVAVVVPGPVPVYQPDPVLREAPAVYRKVGGEDEKQPRALPQDQTERKRVEQTMDLAGEAVLGFVLGHPVVLEQVVPGKVQEQTEDQR